MPRFVDSRCVLAVRDLTKSTQFYTEVLGFREDPVDATRAVDHHPCEPRMTPNVARARRARGSRVDEISSTVPGSQLTSACIGRTGSGSLMQIEGARR